MMQDQLKNQDTTSFHFLEAASWFHAKNYIISGTEGPEEPEIQAA